ncbi:3-oxoacyl-ACP reductase family protein [Oenococcus sicerae]|uniref:3-oxoacyl-ACP reductase family protein n=1 Tax=Oenococcus sicerae TaxID=2203724 RepID=UPI0010B1D5DD|nr:3-oxoacyl-[acyl-carrier-protein] reductase FabG [Oenococcus sicerae]
MDLQGKTVLVTGSTRGIGLAIAEAFYAAGCRVVINGRKAVSDDVLAHFPDSKRVLAIIGDVADQTQAQALVSRTIEHFGQLDVLVNNAGITRDMLANRMSLEDFKAPIEVNLVGSFNVSQAALKPMYHQRSGSIINLASVVGLVGNIGQINYAASKAGLIGMTKTLAREAARRHVRCNAIAPGMIQTDMVAVLAEKTQAQLKEQIPLGDFGSPRVVAQTAVFLAENDYITGQVVTVDGGLTMA